MEKPGERQARPTSCMPMPALSRAAVKGLPEVRVVMGPLAGMALPLDRSSFCGRWREVASSGEATGSFLTMILGGCPPPPRDLDSRSTFDPRRPGDESRITYVLGEDLPSALPAGERSFEARPWACPAAVWDAAAVDRFKSRLVAAAEGVE